MLGDKGPLDLIPQGSRDVSLVLIAVSLGLSYNTNNSRYIEI